MTDTKGIPRKWKKPHKVIDGSDIPDVTPTQSVLMCQGARAMLKLRDRSYLFGTIAVGLDLDTGTFAISPWGQNVRRQMNVTEVISAQISSVRDAATLMEIVRAQRAGMQARGVSRYRTARKAAGR